MSFAFAKDIVVSGGFFMIYTVTLNPSLDYIVRLPSFTPGEVNRSLGETIVVGGKGINVSVMLHALGVESTALGFVAGFSGEEIRRLLRKGDIHERFITLHEGFSRINVKLKTDVESEINGAGPVIAPEELAALKTMLSDLRDGDTLVLSGSVPQSVSQSIYREIAEMLVHKDVMIAVDASGALLSDILPFHPFLIKPNHHELGAFFGVTIENAEQAVHYAKRMQQRGARNVLVSMAGDGAVLVSMDGDVYGASAPKGEVINSVGAGDSMLAGFLAGYLDGGSYERALALGIAAGSASAFCEGIASRDAVEALLL